MTGLFAVVLVVLHLSFEMVVPKYGDFHHFALKFIPIVLLHHTASFPLVSVFWYHQASGMKTPVRVRRICAFICFL